MKAIALFLAVFLAIAASAETVTPEPVLRPAAKAVTPLGGGAIVVEAEQCQNLTYGWVIDESDDAGGGGFIHLREGAGDGGAGGVFNPERRSGDFYNISRDNRPMEARCTFVAPTAGVYKVWVRHMAHRKKCSNIFQAQVNGGSKFSVGSNGSESFVWLWSHSQTMRLQEGLNTVSFWTYQDDVKVDQVVFVPVVNSTIVPRGKVVGALSSMPAALSKGLPKISMNIGWKRLPFNADAAPEAKVYLQNNTGRTLHRTLHVTFSGPGKYIWKKRIKLKLEKGSGLTRLPLELALPKHLERREYLLRCRLMDGKNVEQERTVVFRHGFDWSYLGVLPYKAVDRKGEPEATLVPKAQYRFGDKDIGWKRYSHRFTDHYGIMDFGRLFDNSTYDARHDAMVYAYTEVSVRAAGTYMLKTVGDDDHIIWINGRKVVAFARGQTTPIRSAGEHQVNLDKGRNQILMRLNQRKGSWQAAIWIRTQDDKVSDVTGIPFAKQKLGRSPGRRASSTL